MKEERSGKSRVITIRLKEDEFARFEPIINATGISKSDFFRFMILNQFDPDKHNQVKKDNTRKLLFYFNKASNNLNQITKRINVDHQAGILSEQTYLRYLNSLINIRDAFVNGIEKC